MPITRKDCLDANAPDIEVFLEPVPQDARCQVWVPVTQK